MCSGAAAILKKKAKEIKKRALDKTSIKTVTEELSAEANNKKIEPKEVEPVHPQISEIPKSKSPEEKEPKIKYFRPASVERLESFLEAAKA